MKDRVLLDEVKVGDVEINTFLEEEFALGLILGVRAAYSLNQSQKHYYFTFIEKRQLW